MNHFQYSSKLILITGFAFVIVIMTVITITWAIHVSESKQNIDGIFEQQKQARLLITMRDSARQRAIYLHRMAMMKDEFDRDAEYLKFKAAAGEFIQAKNGLLGLGSEASRELHIWNKARPFIKGGQSSQLTTAELILQDKIDEANLLLLEEVIPIQNKVNEILSELFDVQKEIALKEYQNASDRNERIYWIAILSGGTAVLLTIFIAVIVIRRAVLAEASLDEARVAAQTATEMKSQFLANMSHEIRTPLTAVIGYADNLLGGDLSMEDNMESVSSILRNGKHLLHIINDILDISKIEAGELSIEKIPVDVPLLIQDIDSLIGDRIREKGLKFHLVVRNKIPVQIYTDPTRLKQIILNLLGNAIKFTNTGSIKIEIEYLKQDRKIRFNVVDSGVGMTEDEQSRLFKPFTQADASTTRKFGGTGLGLYISRQLANMLGGDLECNSIKGIGSTFTATVNVGFINENLMLEGINVQSPAQRDRDTVAIPVLSGKVLLAEDNSDNQRLISMYVCNTQADVFVVGNGQQAVEQAISGQYDLILLDMQMPVMGGAEAVKWLRSVGNQTPIVILTASAMKEEKERCLELGANDFLSKPIDKQIFYQVMEKYLGNESGDRKFNQENEEEMHELICEFVNSLPDYVNLLDDALDRQNWSELKSIVHQIKGLGGGFGFQELTDISHKIEVQFKEGNTAIVQSDIADLIDRIEQIIENNSGRFETRKSGT